MTKSEALGILKGELACGYLSRADKNLQKAINIAIENLEKFENNEGLIGKTCYKYYVSKPRYGYPKSRYHYFVDSDYCLKWNIRYEDREDIQILVKKKTLTKSDLNKLNKLVFLNKADAESRLKSVREEVKGGKNE